MISDIELQLYENVITHEHAIKYLHDFIKENQIQQHTNVIH